MFTDISLITTSYRWSGHGKNAAIPQIGDTVTVAMNGLGDGIVRGYRLFDGEGCQWLAVMVEFLNPPAWYIQQNDRNALGTVFGIELEA